MAGPFQQTAVEAVLFDLDGTLIDSVPDLAQAVDRMLEGLGRAVAGEAQVRQWVGNGAPVLVRRALTGVMHPCDEELDPALFERALSGFMDAYAECSSELSVVYAGVREFLDALRSRGLKMALITNKPARFLPDLLKEHRLEGVFEVVLGGDSLAEKKPHPAPLLHAAEQLRVDPARCLMIGDSRNDVGAARAAGCPVACVTYGYNHGEPIAHAEPDWVVDSLLELL